MSDLLTISDPLAPVIQVGENGGVILNEHIAQLVDAERRADEPYPLAMPDNCMYGRAGEWARLIEGPVGPCYIAVLAVSAGVGIRVTDTFNVQPRVYAALL